MAGGWDRSRGRKVRTRRSEGGEQEVHVKEKKRDEGKRKGGNVYKVDEFHQLPYTA